MADSEKVQNESPETEPVTAERRDGERGLLEGEIELEFLDGVLSGRGQNQSAQGVFFLADRLPRVRIRTPSGVRTGELVRVQPQGDGTAGIAVRLLD